MQTSLCQFLVNDQSSAAMRLRQAQAKYRQALIGGDLIAAVKARQALMEAEVLLDVTRAIIEGDIDG